jgi:hypothetical protein
MAEAAKVMFHDQDAEQREPAQGVHVVDPGPERDKSSAYEPSTPAGERP